MNTIAKALTVQGSLMLVVTGSLMGCGPATVPVVDVGPGVVGTPNAEVRGMVWSPDAARLVYSWSATPSSLSSTAATTGGIDVLDVALGTSRRLVGGDCCDPLLVVTTDGKTLFFTEPLNGALRLLRMTLDVNSTATPNPVADHVAAFEVAADGHTVATGDWAGGPIVLVDTIGGATKTLGPGSPIAFSPDQSSLLAAVDDVSPATGEEIRAYFVVDLATGDRRPIALPSSGAVAVVSWDGPSPRLVVQSLLLIDLSNGRQDRIGPGTPYAGLHDPGGTLTHPQVTTWTEVCLETHSDVAEKNHCAIRQFKLWRIDLRTGGTEVIAQTSGQTPAAISPDGHRLGIFDDGAIHVKELP